MTHEVDMPQNKTKQNKQTNIHFYHCTLDQLLIGSCFLKDRLMMGSE